MRQYELVRLEIPLRRAIELLIESEAMVPALDAFYRLDETSGQVVT